MDRTLLRLAEEKDSANWVLDGSPRVKSGGVKTAGGR